MTLKIPIISIGRRKRKEKGKKCFGSDNNKFYFVFVYNTIN